MDVWVLMSGGIDSTACAHYFLQRGSKVTGIFVDYGQSAARSERRAVKQVTAHLGIPLLKMSFDSGRRFKTGEITGRNAFLIFAALVGIGSESGILSLGIHSGTAYYDCGPEFLVQLGKVVDAYSQGKLALHCPFLHAEKDFVYSYARVEQLPLELTYSCELGTVPTCGKCQSCLDRNVLQAC